MKKVGIMTFHAAHNYGSVLQAYALQTVIENKGDKCEIVNFETRNQVDMYSIFSKNNSLKNIAKNIIALSNYKILRKRYSSFEDFSNKYFNLSKKKYKTFEELRETNGKYEVLVCGSDQIWNLNAHDFEEAYFLGFNNIAKKVSYAPSIGGFNTFKDNNNINTIKEYLSDFSHISVREYNAKEVVQPLTDKNIEVVLDPTFLLTSEQWDTIASPRIIDKEYIFFYSIDYNDDAIKIAKTISKKMGLPIIILYTINQTYKAVAHGLKMSDKCSPSDFLSLIKHANLVLSSSFHGSVFSIIYRKPFYVVRGTNKGKINNDDRLTTLLNKCNLNNRDININNVDMEFEDYLIDYSNSEGCIEDERQKSLEFLFNAIDN